MTAPPVTPEALPPDKSPQPVVLRRRVRLFVEMRHTVSGSNSFAHWPTVNQMGGYHEIEVEVTGIPDPTTGYLINIREIDRLVRHRSGDIIQSAYVFGYGGKGPEHLAVVLSTLHWSIADFKKWNFTAVTWHITPFLALTMRKSDPNTIAITHHFEFAAAHRLHVDSLSAEENQRIFGKCNNPSGHGHNYRLAVNVRCAIDEYGRAMSIPTLEQVVHDTIIERFDHKHLNVDTEEFAPTSGVVPSVENIARVCYDLLSPAIDRAGAELRGLTVWETEKTSCTYPAR